MNIKFLFKGLWQVNFFDLWGVELGKVLNSQVLFLMDNADSLH
ncbi:MAG: hypothetical protein QF552_14760 [Litorilituus sp.]|nr:hypothetical protein [Litorilituus sp.]